MMKFVFAGILLMVVFFSFQDAREERHAQAARTAEAAAIIVNIENFNTPDTSKLASELRGVYVEPSDDDVTSLQQLYTRLKANPKSAADYTTEGKIEEMRKSGLDKMQSVLSFSDPTDDVKPGL